MILAGIFASLAYVVLNYSVANGIAGISFSVAKTSPIWCELYTFIFLGEMMTAPEAIAVVMALISGILLLIPEKLDCCAN